MALADELLDSISEEQSAEYMSVETNPHIVIDEDRNIILPERYKIIAAQGDHDMNTYTFDCPRFSDGRDMSKMVVYINYIRSDGETGSYPADNVSIDAQNPNLMHFDWTMLLPATFAHGVLAFLICVCRTETDGKLRNHWSTRMCREAMVSEGMECHTDTIVDLYPDVITRILERLNVLEDGGTTSVQYTVQDLEEEQQKQARTNIGAASASEVSRLSEDIATKASAIKEKASGEVIVVTDSDGQKPLGLAIDGKSEQNQYSGKNLIPYPYKNTTMSKDGLVITDNGDGSVTFNGTNTGSGTIYFNLIQKGQKYMLKAGTYIISKIVSAECAMSFAFQVFDSDGNAIINNSFNGSNNEKTTITTEKDGELVLYFFVGVGKTINNATVHVMIRPTEITDDTWEPYVGGKPSPSTEYKQEIRNIGVYDEASGKYAVGFKFRRKNAIKYPYFNTSSNINGVDFTVNNDGSVTANGTPTNGSAIFIVNINASIGSGKHILSGCPSGGGESTYRMQYTNMTDKGYNDFGNGVEIEQFDYSKYPATRVTVNIANGYKAENLTFYPMIRPVGTDGTYGQSEEITATVLLDEPLRKGDKAYWNGGSKVRIDRCRDVEVFDGSDANLQYESALGRVVTSVIANKVKKPSDNGVVGGIICDKLVADSTNNIYNGKEGIAVGASGVVSMRVNTLTSLDAWKAHLAENPFTVEYELATPITEEIDIDLDLSMFYPTTILSNDCNANMEVAYIADTKAYIDKKFAELATAMV